MENLVIELKMTVPVVNSLLAALGTAPYQTVFGLIDEIKKQAQPQVDLYLSQNPVEKSLDLTEPQPTTE